MCNHLLYISGISRSTLRRAGKAYYRGWRLISSFGLRHYLCMQRENGGSHA
jgi:hypothetical protein